MNEGVHINIAKRHESGPQWIEQLRNRPANFPYEQFTWGTITWGSLRNPKRGYGSGTTTTKTEARQQHQDAQAVVVQITDTDPVQTSGNDSRGSSENREDARRESPRAGGSSSNQPTRTSPGTGGSRYNSSSAGARNLYQSGRVRRRDVQYGSETYSWDPERRAWHYRSSNGTIGWVKSP